MAFRAGRFAACPGVPVHHLDPVRAGLLRSTGLRRSATHRLSVAVFWGWAGGIGLFRRVWAHGQYRLPAGRIAALLDFEQLFADICLVEWPERLGEALVRSPCRAARSTRTRRRSSRQHAAGIHGIPARSLKPAVIATLGCAGVREQPGAAGAQHRGRRATGSIPPRRSTCRRAALGRRAGGLAAGRAVPRGGAGWGGGRGGRRRGAAADPTEPAGRGGG